MDPSLSRTPLSLQQRCRSGEGTTRSAVSGLCAGSDPEGINYVEKAEIVAH